MDMPRLLLLDALRQAAATPGEHRLYQSGKLPGLLAGRTRQNAAVAAAAIRDGLLEIARVETHGRVPVEWVRVTPKGIDFLLHGESPVRALEDLRAALAVSADGLPLWVTEIRQQLALLQRQVAGEVEAIGRRLDGLAGQVQATLEHLKQTHGHAEREPEAWTALALEHLADRAASGLGETCPLGDLFAALKERQVELSLKDFHRGLRALRDRGRIDLLAHAGPDTPPGPEYALLEGATVYYRARRTATGACADDR